VTRFVYDCHMRWGDMDAFAHVNNTAYVTYLEQARVAMFFDRYDGSFAKGTVIARHEIDYLRPVVYHPQPLRIELWVDEVRGASFQVRYEVYDGTVLAARASTRCVPFDFTTDRPRRLTGEERRALAGYGDDPAADEPSRDGLVRAPGTP
jgi:acyl-CoA thioester hydrolase